MNIENKKTVGMIIAMDKEIQPFLNEFGTPLNETEHCGFPVKEYSVYGVKVCVIKSGVGEIHAAAATAILISVFSCEIILNFGVVGALSKDLSVLDTVFLKGVVHYDFDLSAIDGTPAGVYPDENDAVIAVKNDAFFKIAAEFSDIPSVICASGDKFIENKDIKSRLNAEYGASVCDMESAGILLICKNAGVPVIFVKAVSDGEGGADEFTRRVKAALEAYISVAIKILRGLN